jgi:tetratricopeptide (TPR) repeat protein
MFFRPFIIASVALCSLASSFCAHADGKKHVGNSVTATVARASSSGAAPKFDGYDPNQVAGIVSGSVDELWNRTDYYWHRGDFPRIIALDRIIVEMDPGFMEPYSTGGWLMESAGDNTSAEKFYRLGAARNSDSSYMYYQLGMFYFNTTKNYKGALEAAQIGTTKSDAGINDWRLLAHSYEKNGMLPECINTWQYIIKTFPDSGAARRNLERVQGLVAQSQTPPNDASAPAAPQPTTPSAPVISL